MYQPTSWEYIQFLYLANNRGNAFLADEGVNMLEAWLNTGMAEPHVMAQATWGTPPVACSAETPTLQSTTPADKEVTIRRRIQPVLRSGRQGATGRRKFDRH
jgi:hypothetical protein